MGLPVPHAGARRTRRARAALTRPVLVESATADGSRVVREADAQRASELHAPDAERVARLVQAAKHGDRAAEESLYRLHAEGVLRLATKLLRSPEDARDVTQDAFLMAFRDLKGLRDDLAFRAWVLQITVRAVHRRFRKRKWLAFLGMGRGIDEGSLLAMVPGADPSERAELALLDRALRKLEPDEKLIWLLRRVEGWSLLEVSERVGLSLATVKRRLQKSHDVIVEHVGVSCTLLGDGSESDSALEAQ